MAHLPPSRHSHRRRGARPQTVLAGAVLTILVLAGTVFRLARSADLEFHDPSPQPIASLALDTEPVDLADASVRVEEDRPVFPVLDHPRRRALERGARTIDRNRSRRSRPLRELRRRIDPGRPADAATPGVCLLSRGQRCLLDSPSAGAACRRNRPDRWQALRAHALRQPARVGAAGRVGRRAIPRGLEYAAATVASGALAAQAPRPWRNARSGKLLRHGLRLAVTRDREYPRAHRDGRRPRSAAAVARRRFIPVPVRDARSRRTARQRIRFPP